MPWILNLVVHNPLPPCPLPRPPTKKMARPATNDEVYTLIQQAAVLVEKAKNDPRMKQGTPNGNVLEQINRNFGCRHRKCTSLGTMFATNTSRVIIGWTCDQHRIQMFEQLSNGEAMSIHRI
jgi:hypothetical protein